MWVGRVSYGIYLWHFLFTSVAKHGSGPTRVVGVVAAIALTGSVAALSFRFVERPFLLRKQRMAVRATVEPRVA